MLRKALIEVCVDLAADIRVPMMINDSFTVRESLPVHLWASTVPICSRSFISSTSSVSSIWLGRSAYSWLKETTHLSISSSNFGFCNNSISLTGRLCSKTTRGCSSSLCSSWLPSDLISLSSIQILTNSIMIYWTHSLVCNKNTRDSCVSPTTSSFPEYSIYFVSLSLFSPKHHYY